MPQYHTINLDKKYYNALQEFIDERDDYTSVKDFLKQSANEKRQQLQNKETEKLIETLELLLQNTDISRAEVQEIIKEQQ